MRSAMSRKNDRRGRAFNDLVANAFATMEGALVRVRVAALGQLKMPRQLGDIDVLVLLPAIRTLLVVECKDLALARTPDELSHQLGKFVGDDGAEGDATKRHRGRVQWVASQQAAILKHFGIIEHGWRTEGLLVVDEPLFAVYMRTLPMRVVSMEDVRAGRA
jgi:hypothetical protein